MSGEARTYEVIACPVHGTAKLQHGICREVTDRSKTGRITYCHAQVTVTAVDLRDVEPLLDALKHAQEVVGAEAVSADEEVRLLAHLGEALEPFASTQQGGER